METKQAIRKKIFALRKEWTPEQVMEQSRVIAKTVMGLAAFQEAAAVYAYADCKNEVSTKPLIEACWKLGKKVAVPKVHGKDMVFYELTDYSQLEPGYFGVPEPARGQVAQWEDALMIMPGVAFDAQRHRAGYGAGFYDRFLAEHRQHPTVAVAFDFQMVDGVPSEETDILPQILVTESTTYK